MDDLNSMGLATMSNRDLYSTNGGLLIGNFSTEWIELIQWAYTEYKKGVADGYAGV